ncbi:hypothetical protein BJV78DRAFT_1238510 [Lactifluus subvellereus]|nr:hypothetical protein BJV78DRAFT_1267939 [Lactifluus subvellereus]KAI0248270.1 hypothetical protein BJV78DRAFT_1238510 [Lactifluus subvellereus]
MNIGGVSLSLDGPAGGESSALQPDGIHDEMRNFLVKQGLDRIGLQYYLSARDANTSDLFRHHSTALSSL